MDRWNVEDDQDEVMLDAEHMVDTEDGEVLDLQQFEALQMERNVKLENLACYIKNVEAEAEAIYTEVDALSKRARVKKNEAERCKNYLAQLLEGEKFETSRYKVTFRTNTVCNVLDISKVPEQFLRRKEVVEANKVDIKKFCKDGAKLPGVEVVTKQSMVLK
jgi:cytidylate kinase